MEVLQVTFRNMKSSPTVEEWIREEASKLETFYSQIMGCRVAVEVPHRHHVKGSPYHVRIDLTLARRRTRHKARGQPGLSRSQGRRKRDQQATRSRDPS